MLVSAIHTEHRRYSVGLDTLANSIRGNFLLINFTPHLLVLVLPHWLTCQKYDCICINCRDQGFGGDCHDFAQISLQGNTRSRY